MRRLWTAAGMAGLLAACGGDRAPTAAVPPPALSGIVAGTVLTIVGGESGQPVAGATVIVDGRTYSADGSGHVALAQGVAPGVLLDILSEVALDRQTLLRSATATVFPLWPRRSPTRLDEDYTRRMVYSWDDEESPGTSPLYRLSGTQAVLQPSGELQGDADAMAAHRRAADEMNAAAFGAVHYAVAAQAASAAVVFTTTVDPDDEDCTEDTLALTGIRVRNEEIVSGRIVFCTLDSARDSTVVHEVGHTFGLGHSPDPSELMHGFKRRGQAETFSDRESLVMRLMLQRHGGNRFPDNDRAVGVAGERDVRIVCH